MLPPNTPLRYHFTRQPAEPLAPPAVWLVEDQSRVRIDPGSEMLFAYPGSRIIEHLLVDTRRARSDWSAGERRTYVPPVRIMPSFFGDDEVAVLPERL